LHQIDRILELSRQTDHYLYPGIGLGRIARLDGQIAEIAISE
jgi:hypothetical protein